VVVVVVSFGLHGGHRFCEALPYQRVRQAFI
jgi:hypothetical protein